MIQITNNKCSCCGISGGKRFKTVPTMYKTYDEKGRVSDRIAGVKDKYEVVDFEYGQCEECGVTVCRNCESHKYRRQNRCVCNRCEIKIDLRKSFPMISPLQVMRCTRCGRRLQKKDGVRLCLECYNYYCPDCAGKDENKCKVCSDE